VNYWSRGSNAEQIEEKGSQRIHQSLFAQPRGCQAG
jgi:hypothetical protein